MAELFKGRAPSSPPELGSTEKKNADGKNVTTVF